jgi:hypothetical protein
MYQIGSKNCYLETDSAAAAAPKSEEPGTEFIKCFLNFSTIIHTTILLQANPDAPNSSTRERIVEELWKNCRKILQALDQQGRQGRIV